MNETTPQRHGQDGLATEALLIVTGLFIVGGIFYLWSYAQRNNEANGSILSSAESQLNGSQPSSAELASSLAAAETKLAKQNLLLSTMETSFPSSPALDEDIARQFGAAEAAVAKTDMLWNGPDSAAPVLKEASADPVAATALSALRVKVNEAIAAWPRAMASEGSTLSLSQTALSGLRVMQSYLARLESYFDAVSPTTALQADVIIADRAELSDEAAAVNDAIIGVTAVGGPTVVALGGTVGGSPGSSGNGSSAAGSGSASGDSSSGSGDPGTGGTAGTAATASSTITVGDIIVQQDTVASTTIIVDQIQQQIDTAGNGSDGSNGSSGGNQTDQGNQNNADTGNGNTGYSDNSQYGQSDQFDQSNQADQSNQSGGPQLIQGSNPF